MNRITKATYADCLHVARRLRKLDAEEITPMLYRQTAEALAAHTIASQNVWVATTNNGEPAAIFGWTPGLPCVAQVFFFATDRWREVAAAVSKFCKTRIKLQLAGRVGTVNRAECWTLQRHHDARAWLQWLGFRVFGISSDTGPNRETYIGYCYTRSMIEAEQLTRAQKRKGVFHATGRKEKRLVAAASAGHKPAVGTGNGRSEKDQVSRRRQAAEAGY